MGERRILLKQAAGDYSAGDLSPEDALAFEELMAKDPVLTQETAFWRGLRGSALVHPGPPPPLPADLAEVIIRRSALAVRRPVVRQPRSWFFPMTAAAALVLAVGGWGLGRYSSATGTPLLMAASVITEKDDVSLARPVAWMEDGSQVMPPSTNVSWASYMPQRLRSEVETSVANPVSGEAKPWIGVWSKPAKLLEKGSPLRDAHLVIRVVEGGPAWNLGIRPGDMMLSLNGCPLMTPDCMGEAMVTLHAGDRVPAAWWSTGDGKRHDGSLILQAVHE